jgi:DNA-binding NarL/FixJ family response regulator
MTSLRILIADDNPLVRSAIRLLLDSHHEWLICGEAANGFEAVEQAAALKPDVILLDIAMPELDGLTAVPLIRQQAPETQIIILTLHESLDMARTAALKGATVYIAKSLIAEALVPAIESLHSEMDVLRQSG